MIALFVRTAPPYLERWLEVEVFLQEKTGLPSPEELLAPFFYIAEHPVKNKRFFFPLFLNFLNFDAPFGSEDDQLLISPYLKHLTFLIEEKAPIVDIFHRILHSELLDDFSHIPVFLEGDFNVFHVDRQQLDAQTDGLFQFYEIILK